MMKACFYSFKVSETVYVLSGRLRREGLDPDSPVILLVFTRVYLGAFWKLVGAEVTLLFGLHSGVYVV